MEGITSTLDQVTGFVSRQSAGRLAGLTALTTSTIVATWVLLDYNAWLSFGTGGTPPTWAGYWKMTKLRFNHLLSGTDLRDASSLDASLSPCYLPDSFDNKRRRHTRPTIVSRTMPQRQIPWKRGEVDDGVQARVAGICATLGLRYENLVFVAPAKTEGGVADGLYARRELSTLNPTVNDPKNKILDGEIGHAHPADRSLHVWLSEADAKRVVESGWGERFPLTFVPKGWVMVYAPTTHEEADVVEEIFKAAIGWVCGQKVE